MPHHETHLNADISIFQSGLYIRPICVNIQLDLGLMLSSRGSHYRGGLTNDSVCNRLADLG